LQILKHFIVKNHLVQYCKVKVLVGIVMKLQ